MKYHYCSLFASGKVTMFLCVYSAFLLLFYQGTYKLNLKVRDHGGKELMCINAPQVKVAWLQHQTDLMYLFCESECAQFQAEILCSQWVWLLQWILFCVVVSVKAVCQLVRKQWSMFSKYLEWGENQWLSTRKWWCYTFWKHNSTNSMYTCLFWHYMNHFDCCVDMYMCPFHE